MPSLKRQITDSEKQQVLAQQRRDGVLYCFVTDHPIEDEGDVEFHHIKPFSEDGPTEIANIGAVCKEHHRRIRTLSLSEFRDQLEMDRFFDHPDQRRLDDLLGLKLSAVGFGRQVSVDGDQTSQATLHFTNPDRPPQVCSVFSCPRDKDALFLFCASDRIHMQRYRVAASSTGKEARLGALPTPDGAYATSPGCLPTRGR